MKKLITFAIGLIIFFMASGNVFAQQDVQAPVNKFYLARVNQIVEEGQKDLGDGFSQPFQKIKLQVLSGDLNGQEIEIDHGSLFSLQENQIVKQGQFVIINKQAGPEGDIFYIADRFRLGVPAIFALGVLLLIAVFARGRNLGVLVGLIASFAVLFKYLVPQLLLGGNVYILTLVAVALILALIILSVLGVNKKAVITFVSTLLVSMLLILVNFIAFEKAFITGSGSEEAIFLQTGTLTEGDLRNILFASVVIGTLGFLVYVTHKQIDLIEKLKTENKKLQPKQLMRMALVNPERNLSFDLTAIFLAFVGASLPILLLFGLNQSIPFWVTANSEFMMQEILRILLSFAAIALAVPVTTFVASGFLVNEKTN